MGEIGENNTQIDKPGSEVRHNEFLCEFSSATDAHVRFETLFTGLPTNTPLVKDLVSFKAAFTN